jgi:salicylate hydroxylase
VAGQHVERRNPVGAINIDVPLALLRQDSALSSMAEEGQNFWQGPGGTCAAGPVRDTGVFNMCWVSEEKLGGQGEWFVKGELDKVATKYKDWDPRLLKLVTLSKPEDCYVWNITDLPPLPSWSTERIVIIGDAAHATLPFLGLVSTLTC